MADTDHRWYWARGTDVHGPVDRADIERKIAASQLGPDDLVWHPSWGAEWRPTSALATGPRRRFEKAATVFGPLAGGIALDAVDFITRGPAAFFFGFPIGLWLGYVHRLRGWQIVLCGIGAGLYCMMPGTRWLPLGTLIGAVARYREIARGG